MNLSTKTACVIDNGLFVSLAEKIAPSFAKVYYANPTENAFELSAEHTVGSGLEGVEPLKSPAAAYRKADQIDLFIFPDILYADAQAFLRERGHRVWGAGDAEQLELDRLKFKRLLAKLDLDVLPENEPGGYQHIKGMDDAEAWIKEHPGKPYGYLKTARHAVPFRGDFETLKYRTYAEVEHRLQEIRQNLGAHASKAEFIIEPHIEGIEVAADCYSSDGVFPDAGMFGLEIKGDCLVGKFVPYEHYPEELREINAALGPTLKRGHCRGMCAVETRFTEDGSAYAQDPCMRFGRPQMGIQELFANWPEILWGVAGGEMVNPEKAANFVAEAVVDCDYGEEHPVPIEIPKELEGNLKLSNKAKVGGRIIAVPHPRKLSMIGTLCATGSTMAKAIENVRAMAKEVTGYRLQVTDAFDKAEDEIGAMKAYGIDF